MWKSVCCLCCFAMCRQFLHVLMFYLLIAIATQAIFCLQCWCVLFENYCAAGMGWWPHFVTRSVILSQKIKLIEFLPICFLWFFSCHITWRGYTCDFHHALVTRQFKKKSHHHHKQKIVRVAAALAILECKEGLLVVSTYLSGQVLIRVLQPGYFPFLKDHIL